MLDLSLSKLPIFNGMSEQEIHEALSSTQVKEVNRGEQIITQGRLKRNLWFIREGRCAVKRNIDSGSELQLAELGPGAQFGEMSFFHAAPHSASIIALTEMKLLQLAYEDYDRLCAAGNPIAFKLALNSLEQLTDRLRRTDQWITDLVCQKNYQYSASEWTSFRELVFRGD